MTFIAKRFVDRWTIIIRGGEKIWGGGYIEGLNLSIAYIEDHLLDAIDYEKAARIAGMSKSTYQRFFLLIANMTLDEYIRKRRLHYAVKELVDTDHRIIDIAMKYGYHSATAFSRAIRNFTGSTPSKVREEGPLVCFPKLHFQIWVNEERQD